MPPPQVSKGVYNSRRHNMFVKRGRQKQQQLKGSLSSLEPQFLSHNSGSLLSCYLEEFLGLGDFVPQLSGRAAEGPAGQKWNFLKSQKKKKNT